MKRLLLLSAVRWNFLWQRHQALAIAATEAGWDVDFVEPPLRGVRHVASALRTRLRGGAPSGVANPVPDHVRVVRPTNVFPFLPKQRQQNYLRSELPGRYDACILYLPTGALVDFAEFASPVRIYDNVVDWPTAPRNWFAPRDFRAAEQRMCGPGWQRMTDSPVPDPRMLSGSLLKK